MLPGQMSRWYIFTSGGCCGAYPVEEEQFRRDAHTLSEIIENFYNNDYLNIDSVDTYKDEYHKKFAEAWLEAFDADKYRSYDYDIPEKIEFDFFNHDIGITTEHVYGTNNYVTTIKVNRNEYSSEDNVVKKIERNLYSSVSTVMLLRRNFPDAQADISLSSERRIIMKGDHFKQASLEGIELNEADLRGADWSGVKLFAASLDGTDFSGANLCGADFGGSNMVGADFRGTDLREADFSGAVMTDADLRDANLKNVKFNGANVTGIKVSGVNNSLTLKLN